MLFNGRALIFTFSGTQVRIAEHERLQSLFDVYGEDVPSPRYVSNKIVTMVSEQIIIRN